VAFGQVQTDARLWFRDREGTEDYARLCFPLGWGHEAAIDLANGAFAAYVGALSECRFCASDIEFSYLDDPPPAGLAAAADVADQAGTLFFLCDDLVQTRFELSIPGFVSAGYLPDGVEINRSQTDVAALIAELTATGGNACINRFGARLLSCDVGMRRYLPLLFREATG